MSIDPGASPWSIPAYNEAGKVGQVVRKVPRQHVGWVIVVDDASSDDTSQEAARAGADQVVRHAVNRGVGAGIRTGLMAARSQGYEFRGDPLRRRSARAGRAAAAARAAVRGSRRSGPGSRWLPGGATPGIGSERRWLTRLYPLLFRLASGYPSTDGTNGLRAFRLALLDHPAMLLDQSWLDRYELEPYLLFKAVRLGFRRQSRCR